jgi:hypothetical protein
MTTETEAAVITLWGGNDLIGISNSTPAHAGEYPLSIQAQFHHLAASLHKIDTKFTHLAVFEMRATADNHSLVEKLTLLNSQALPRSRQAPWGRVLGAIWVSQSRSIL